MDGDYAINLNLCESMQINQPETADGKFSVLTRIGERATKIFEAESYGLCEDFIEKVADNVVSPTDYLLDEEIKKNESKKMSLSPVEEYKRKKAREKRIKPSSPLTGY